VTLRVTTRPLEDPRPLLDLSPDPTPLAWIRGGDGLVAWGAAVRIEPGPGPARFARADARLRDLAVQAHLDDEVGAPGGGLVAMGSFSFDVDASGSVLVVPRVVVGRRHGRTWVTTIDPADAPACPGPNSPDDANDPDASPPMPVTRDRPRYAGSSNPDLRWLEAVATAVDRIREGEAEKVVLARDVAVWSHEVFDQVDLARRLTSRFPSCHTFIVDGLVGATPELLLSLEGDLVRSRVLAGTVGRADDEAEDAALGAGLLASEKDRWEHQLAADSVRDVLGPRCTDLTYEPEPRLLRLDNVQHLATDLTGHLDVPASSLELVAELHPTAAVGGTPRGHALEMIRELEGMDRGRYAAPVGWTTADGDGEWGIALRCAQIEGARARLFAGVGVVSASLPESELEETRLKLLAMQRVMGPTRG
jgi:menaquinone-specific isochorismate synthase